MADLTLLVLAAGIGRRYQGLKQIEPVGPSGEAILDYAVYDALRSGFSRVVFVIRREIESAFRRATGGFWEERVPVSYVFQELEGGLPAGAEVPPQRRKPWGTAHAVLLCGETIATPFAAINADDFYGREAYRGMGSWLAGLNVGTPDGRDEFAFVGYPLKKTLSAHGAVSRGVCALDAGGGLREVVERVKIEKAGEGARALVAPGQWLALTGEEVVSMNFWGFTPRVFGHLERSFAGFIAARGRDPEAEFFLPSAVNDLILAGKVRVRNIPTQESWFGMTYPGDVESVRSWIRELVGRGVYPRDLRGERGLGRG